VNALATLPRLSVDVDGVPLGADLIRGLTEVRVQQRLSQPAQCELTFSEPADELLSAVSPGSALRLLVDAGADALFSGEVTALEYVYGSAHGYDLRVRAYDPLHRLRKRQTVRVHVQVTVADLAQELVADLGLAVSAADSGPLWQHLIQHQQTDFELLDGVAQACGLYLAVRSDELHLLTLAGIGEPVPLALGQSLLEARIEVNGDPACRSVTATGWDPLRVETHAGTADAARVGRLVGADVSPGQVGGSGGRDLVDQATPDDRHAEGIAQSELDVRVAREVTFWGIAEGDARLQPGTPVDVAGVAGELAGRYVLTAVTHTIDHRTGFVSELQTAPPPPPTRPRNAVVALGEVTRVDDPDGRGRVRVSLPTYGRVETDWMGVLSPGAGPQKGLVALPNVGDQVLVLFAHGDPGQGIVLGGLWGMTGPPDSGAEGGAIRRYLFGTSGGQRLLLDDVGERLRLEDSSGSYFELAPGRVVLHSSAALVVEAPGQAVTVRGQSIDFQRA
jgi:uncharacterized protein involved in type VI secretion and phage assembly